MAAGATSVLRIPCSAQFSFIAVSLSAFPISTFSLEYRPDLGIFIGGWLQALLPPELQGTYEVMLVTAKAHDNC